MNQKIFHFHVKFIELNATRTVQPVNNPNDEKLARQIALQDYNNTIPRNVNQSQTQAQTPIRLFHPQSKSSIGELVYMINIDQRQVYFRLQLQPGKLLRIKPDYTVDFADTGRVEAANLFVVIVLSGNMVYLTNK